MDEKINKPERKSKKNFFILLSFVIVIILIGLLLIFTPRTLRPDNAIKKELTSTKKEAQKYYSANKTYYGFEPSAEVVKKVKESGSKLTYQSPASDSFLVYAMANDGKTIYCMDNKGFNGKVTSISPEQKTCKKN